MVFSNEELYEDFFIGRYKNIIIVSLPLRTADKSKAASIMQITFIVLRSYLKSDRHKELMIQKTRIRSASHLLKTVNS